MKSVNSSVLSLPVEHSAPAGTQSVGVARHVGVIERVDNRTVHGWAIDFDCLEESVSVDICARGIKVGSGIANQTRQELNHAGVGSGHHGFSIPVDIPFSNGEPLALELYCGTTGKAIAAIPYLCHCRHPLFLQEKELDARGLHGQLAVRPSWRRRKFNALALPLLKPLRRMSKRVSHRRLKGRAAVSPTPEALPGVAAKLSRIDNTSLTDVDNVSNWPIITLPEYDSDAAGQPGVSVIIPAFNQFQLTYQCLMSLVLSGDRSNIEYLVVDDASSDATALIESRVRNLRVVRNESNLGFLHSCNKAAALASGQYIVFLNNDTEVERCWIDQMLSVFNEFDCVGAVGAKLVYPDGTLQDAGGIVWESGQPWNVGHGSHRDDPEYNYVREVDYLTGAALMVCRKAWEQVGGFSEQYTPAYYEDTDLAFKLREAGYRTLYCPRSVVVHYEGRSHGTDTSQGVKQHQLVNADRFKSTWKEHFTGHGREGGNLRRHKDRNRGLRILMIDNSFPRLGQDAGSYAAMQEIRMLLALGCKLTFLPNNLLHLGMHVERLQNMGVECVYAPFHGSVREFLERRASEFDAVYITRYVVAEKIIPIVRQHSEAKIIFNNADLHFLREMRTAIQAGQSDLSDVAKTRERELAVMRAVDVVLSYSDIELEIISSHLLGNEKLFRCPWVLHPASVAAEPHLRHGISFLGGFAHPPNRAAVDWFLFNVMPELNRRRPELTFHIWGSHLPENSGWDNVPGVVVEGYAETLDEVFNNTRVFIAPLQAGAGIKGKVLDSLAFGVPTVLSPVAAEATGLIDGSSTLVARSPEQWITHIEQLLDDEHLWSLIRENSIELRNTQYSLDAGITAMQTVFDFLKLDTTVLRQQGVV